MTGAPTIKELSVDDSDLLYQFFKAINNPLYKRNFSPHPFSRDVCDRICRYEGDDLYVGVFTEMPRRVVGYGMLRGLDDGYDVPSLGLCVLEEMQGRSIGRRLLAHLLNAAAAKGVDRVMLKVMRDNLPAKRLYESAGFRFRPHDEQFLIGNRQVGPSTLPIDT